MEQQILFLINRQWATPALDLFMAAMSSFALWKGPMIVAAVATALFGRFRARALLIVLLASIGIGNGVFCYALKIMAARPRPYEMMADVRRVDLQNIKPAVRALFQEAKTGMSHPVPGRVIGQSFPSAHAFNNFSLATALAIFYRRRGWLYFIPASVVAYSRVYVGAHWPGDVLAGIFLGMGITLLMTSLLDGLWRSYGGKILPRLHAMHPGLFAKASA